MGKGGTKMRKVLLLPVYLLILAGCDVSFNSAIRSGDLENDYVEEPLSSLAKKYEKALKVTNKAVKSISEENYTHLHKYIFEKNLQQEISIEALERGFKENINKFGAIKEYKEMQWKFIPREEEIGNILYSVKIVKHEKTDVNYVFMFVNDGKYHRIIGLHTVKKDGVSPPGQI
jgi:hypothetical protein